MPSLQGLRRKIGSIKNTQKITKAMKMVAAAKLKRAQERILAARPYAKKMAVVLGSLASRANRQAHPLLRKSAGNRIELLVVTSDRGLCGAFNTNILRKAVEFLRLKQEAGCTVAVSVVGRDGWVDPHRSGMDQEMDALLEQIQASGHHQGIDGHRRGDRGAEVTEGTWVREELFR